MYMQPLSRAQPQHRTSVLTERRNMIDGSMRVTKSTLSESSLSFEMEGHSGLIGLLSLRDIHVATRLGECRQCDCLS